MTEGEAFDSLETPRCPIHATTRLTAVAEADDAHDARWVCPVDGCTIVLLA